MSPWTVYWITRLNSILFVAMLVLILTVAIAFVMSIRVCAEYDDLDDEEKAKVVQRFSWMALIAVCAVLVLSLVPSTREACVIYIVPKLAQGVDWSRIPKVVSDLLMKTCGVQ